LACAWLTSQWPCAAAAQDLAVAGITYGQPQVVPGEYTGDLSRKSLAAEAAIVRPKIYRPRLPGPAQTKSFTAGAGILAPTTRSAPVAPMPAPIQNFAGLSSSDNCTGGPCGAGWPPDPN